MAAGCLHLFVCLLLLAVTSTTDGIDSETVVLPPYSLETVYDNNVYISNNKNTVVKPSRTASSPPLPDDTMYNDESEARDVAMLEGDIMIDSPSPGDILPGELPSRRKRKVAGKLWPRNIIPWEINTSLPAYSGDALDKLKQAMAWWEKHTCIKFVPASQRPNVGHNRVLSISNEKTCASYIGYRSTLSGTKQSLRLYESHCFSGVGTPAHELGHSLGLIHEHTRRDRDKYVKINPNVINSFSMHNFEKAHESTVPSGVNYDLSSIMHYRPTSFSMSSRQPVILSHNLKKQSLMGQREALSFYDIKAVNLNYNCRGSCNNRCENEGYPHLSNGRCICMCPEGLTGSRCEKVDATCGGTITLASGQTTQLTSPRYPQNPDSWHKTCRWLLQAPAGHLIEVKFDAMDVVTTKSSIYRGSRCLHHIEVRNNLLGQRGDIYCGNGQIGPVNTELGEQKNKMLITLDMSDSSVRRGAGFTATVTSYVDACLSDPCHHGSTCVSRRSHSYTCNCAPGFTGRLCDVVTDGSVTCDFADDMCGMENSQQDQLDFHREFRAYKYRELMERDSNGNKFFLVAPVQYSTNPSSVAKLETPTFNSAARQKRCLSFYSKIDGSWQTGVLHVRLIDPVTRSAIRTLTTLSKSSGSGWRETRIQIDERSNYRVEFMFRTSASTTYNSLVGIDDIKVLPQSCVSSPCSSQPCSAAGSTCVETSGTTYRCICPTGKTGDRCDRYDTNGFMCDFNSPDACGWRQDKTDSFDWLRTHGASDALKRTGPTASVGGNGYYLVADTSSSTAPTGSAARIISPQLMYTGQLCISFYYHMFGDRVGSLRMKTMNGGRFNTEIPFHKSGSQSRDWIRQEVNLWLTRQATQIVFEATVGTRHLSDIAVDDVKITRGRCALGYTARTATSTRAPATTRTPVVPRAPATARIPVTVRKLAPASSRSSVSSSRQTSSPSRSTADPSTDLLLSCDFESDTCPSQLVSKSSRSPLVRSMYGTPTRQTGPEGAYEGRYYVYMEASYPAVAGDFIQLTSGHLHHSGLICVSYAYHMRGSHVGQLQAGLVSNGATRPVWSRWGEQSTEWQYYQLQTSIRYNDKVFLKAVRGNGVESDISLDSIKVTKGPCSSEKITPSTPTAVTQRSSNFSYQCDFEGGDLCEFTNLPSDDIDWMIHSGQTPSLGTGPDKAQSGSRYIYIESSYPALPGSKAILQSPEIPANNGEVCVSFYYHISGEGVGRLYVYQKMANSRTRTILYRSKSEGTSWRRMWTSLPNSTTNYKVIFEGSTGTGTKYWSSDIALDRIQIYQGKCH